MKVCEDASSCASIRLHRGPDEVTYQKAWELLTGDEIFFFFFIRTSVVCREAVDPGGRLSKVFHNNTSALLSRFQRPSKGFHSLGRKWCLPRSHPSLPLSPSVSHYFCRSVLTASVLLFLYHRPPDHLLLQFEDSVPSLWKVQSLPVLTGRLEPIKPCSEFKNVLSLLLSLVFQLTLITLNLFFFFLIHWHATCSRLLSSCRKKSD